MAILKRLIRIFLNLLKIFEGESIADDVFYGKFGIFLALGDGTQYAILQCSIILNNLRKKGGRLVRW